MCVSVRVHACVCVHVHACMRACVYVCLEGPMHFHPIPGWPNRSGRCPVKRSDRWMLGPAMDDRVVMRVMSMGWVRGDVSDEEGVTVCSEEWGEGLMCGGVGGGGAAIMWGVRMKRVWWGGGGGYWDGSPPYSPHTDSVGSRIFNE